MDKVQKPFNTFKPNEIDIKLVGELEVDARQSTYSLSAKLGISHSTIFRRLQKLINENHILIVAVVNPPAMGFKTAALIRMTTRPGKSVETASQITALPSVGSMSFRFLTACTGRYNLQSFIVFHTPNELFDFVDKELRSVPDLIDIQVMQVMRVVKNSQIIVGGNTSLHEAPSECQLDQLDIDLVKQLITSPRESATSLAKKMGIRKGIAVKRLQALLELNVVNVFCIADPVIFGYPISVGMWVKALPGAEISKVAEAAASYLRIKQIIIFDGPFDLFLHGNFKDLDELNDFLLNEAGNIPGISRLETVLEFRLPDNPFSVINR